MSAGAPTRRGFLAGALAAAAAPVLGSAEAADAPVAPMRAQRRLVPLGRAIAVSPRGGRLVVAHEWRHTVAIVTPARRRTKLVDVGGQPLEVAISPDGRLAAVTTASWDGPGLAVVDLHHGGVRTRVDVGPAPSGVAFTPSGRRLVVGGGEQEGTVHVLETERFAVVASGPLGPVPRAVVAPAGDATAWVVLNALDCVARVDLRTGHVTRTVRTPRLPDRLAVSPDGRRLLVTHGGRDAEHISEIALVSGRLTRHHAGRLPSAVAWTRRGRRLVALGGEGAIAVLGATGGRRLHRVGGAPRGLAVAGSRAWTADALSDAIHEVRA